MTAWAKSVFSLPREETSSIQNTDGRNRCSVGIYWPKRGVWFMWVFSTVVNSCSVFGCKFVYLFESNLQKTKLYFPQCKRDLIMLVHYLTLFFKCCFNIRLELVFFSGRFYSSFQLKYYSC